MAFSKGMTRARKTLHRFRRSVIKITKSIAKFTGVLNGLALVGGLVLITKGAFKTIDNLAKTADKLGLTTEALAGLRHAAELSGVATGTLDMAIQRMTRRLAEAAQGTGEAKAALAELGLNAKQLTKLPVDQQFMAIADAMERVESQGERIRLGFKLFDSEGVALINTLRGGSAALLRARQDAEHLGLTIGRMTAVKVETFNNAIIRTKAAVQGFAQVLAITLAPKLEAFAEMLTGAAILVRKHAQQVIEMAVAWAKWAAAIVAAAVVIPTVIIVIKALVTGLLGLAKGIAIVLSLGGPAGWAVLAVGAAVATAAAVVLDRKFGDMTTKIEEAIEAAKREGAAITKAGEATRKGAEAIDQFNTIKERSISPAEQFVRTLQREIDTLGMSAFAVKIYDLKKQGANNASIARIRLLHAEVEALKKAAKAEKDTAEAMKQATTDRMNNIESLAQKWQDATLTPMGHYQRGLREINLLLKEGRLTQFEYGRALTQLQNALAGPTASGTGISAPGMGRQIDLRHTILPTSGGKAAGTQKVSNPVVEKHLAQMNARDARMEAAGGRLGAVTS